MTAETGLAPLVKTTTVPQDPPNAFRLFTEHMGEWWPLVTHSVGERDAISVVIGSAVGAQIIETMRSGDTTSWGTITAWEPPNRVAFSWHPGTPEHEATFVEVTFAVAGDGTEVTLTHTGWDNRPDGAAARANYNPGWDFVLGHYTGLAAGQSS